jgi:chromate transporter
MWQMFIFFFQLGFVSFGGGYALIPMIEKEAIAQHWMTSEAFVHAVAVAGTSPGPIAVNLGTVIGYRTYSVAGALAALAGLLIPSFLMATLLLFVIYRLRKQALIDRLFYGLQPVVVAMILFAVYRLGIGQLGQGAWGDQLLFGVIVVGAGWLMLVRYRMPPFFILLFSAICGVAFWA